MLSTTLVGKLDTTGLPVVSNLGFEQINESEDTEVGQPHGSAKITTRLVADGKKEVVSFKFNRLDEGVFNFGNAFKTVRWVRNLEVEKIAPNTQRMDYSEFYIIGRSREAKKEERADIKTRIEIIDGKPKTILVQIGFGDFRSGQIIYENKEAGISVCANQRDGQNQIDVLKQDPTYALLFQQEVDPEEFIESLMGRVEMLRNDWDKPQTVYQSASEIEQTGPAITQLE